jgi:hypothetical protein
MNLWRVNPEEIVAMLQAWAAETANADPAVLEAMARRLEQQGNMPKTWAELAAFSQGITAGVLGRSAERIQAALDGTTPAPIGNGRG